MLRRLTLVLAAAGAVLASTASAPAAPVPDPAGLLDLPAGYSYTVLATSCASLERSTESGLTFPMPEDPDGKVLFKAKHGQSWLLINQELTQPRPLDFQGDAGKCHVDEQTPGDNDSDGWGSVSRLTLAKDGVTVLNRELITTGLHNLCASAITPWKTYLTNEEFPFLVDPNKTSGWVWEIDPRTGAQTRLTGMGHFSHEQEAFAKGGVYLTDDRGNAQFIYRFVPNKKHDLTTGKLYGLAFNKATGVGTWVGPLDPLDPENDMIAHGKAPALSGFVKAEGIVGTHADGRGGNAVYFSESGAGSDPGRVWRLDHLGNKKFVRGHVVVEGDWARLGRPDNLRFDKAGDLFIMEDHSGGDFANNPSTGGVNQIWVLPHHKEGSNNLVLFGQTPDEPTGPWFSDNGKLLYLSLQADPPRVSHVIAIRAPKSFNKHFKP